MASEFLLTFCNRNIYVTVTSDPVVVEQWITSIQSIHARRLHKLVVGLDIEWRPSIFPGFLSPLAVLQLCVGCRCLIFQILRAPALPFSLHMFLSNQLFIFVGVGIHEIASRLGFFYQLPLQMSNIVDLRYLAADRYDNPQLCHYSLENLATVVLGMMLQKPMFVALSDWDIQELATWQIEYASIDAFISFEIGRDLCAWI